MTYAGRLFYEHSGEGEVFLYFDYNPTVVEAVKFAVPVGHRRWSPENRRWVVSEEYWPRLRRTLIDYGVFDEAAFEERHQRRYQRRDSDPGPQPRGGAVSSWATLHLLPDAPPEVVKAAYLALAKLHHPDWADGDDDYRRRNDAMTKINVAYEALTTQGIVR